MNTFKAGLLSLCLLLLSACSTTPEPIVKTVTVVQVQKLQPPQQLMQACPMPAMTVTTNQDLVILIGELYQALATCDFDKQQLRDWVAEAP
ncbi:Rz1-like lysis system protein LysC [Neiella marina]|uniref:Rz1-like lysis system protein LysC n=1 Tax=Neiella marina TaxID=508461 RepID=UPI0035309269